MSEPAAISEDPWKTLDRIARLNIILGLFIWSRVVFEVIEIHTGSWRGSQFFAFILIIDLAMGVLSVASGVLLRQRHPTALLIAAVAGGAIYVNSLFGMVISFPAFFSGLPKLRLFGSHAVTTGTLASHFVQSGVLMLYWTAALFILFGDLKHRRFEEAHRRPVVLTCLATSASSMAAVQILLRLLG